jgi:hypothetical protein
MVRKKAENRGRYRIKKNAEGGQKSHEKFKK